MEIGMACSYYDGILKSLDGDTYDLNELCKNGFVITLKSDDNIVRFIPGIYEPYGDVSIEACGNNSMMLKCSSFMYPWYDYMYPMVSATQSILKEYNREVSYSEAAFFIEHSELNKFIESLVSEYIKGGSHVSNNVRVSILNNDIKNMLTRLYMAMIERDITFVESQIVDILFGKYTVNVLHKMVETGQISALGSKEVDGHIVPTVYGISVVEVIKNSCYKFAHLPHVGYGMVSFKDVDFTVYLDGRN